MTGDNNTTWSYVTPEEFVNLVEEFKQNVSDITENNSTYDSTILQLLAAELKIKDRLDQLQNKSGAVWYYIVSHFETHKEEIYQMYNDVVQKYYDYINEINTNSSFFGLFDDVYDEQARCDLDQAVKAFEVKYFNHMKYILSVYESIPEDIDCLDDYYGHIEVHVETENDNENISN